MATRDLLLDDMITAQLMDLVTEAFNAGHYEGLAKDRRRQALGAVELGLAMKELQLSHASDETLVSLHRQAHDVAAHLRLASR